MKKPTDRKDDGWAEASYLPSDEPQYRHNCFIEALPPTLSPNKAARLMRRAPDYDDSERSLHASRRLEAVQRIANIVVPLPEYLEIEQKFSRMIRNGYLARNPLSQEWVKQIRAGFPNLDWDRGSSYPYTPLIRSTAAGFSIIGASGVGKSTLIESILSLWPQVIIHREYNGQPFDQQQVVWLKIDCPFDGSPRGLCSSFFQKLDQLLGTRHAIQYNNTRRTTDDLLPIMANTAGMVGLGVLVIDEIQRLRGAQKGNSDKLLQFFVQLTSTISVPVVLMGTYKALDLFSREFAMARRTAGQGDVIMHNLAQDANWDYFLERIWKYQWTNVPTPLNRSLSQALYDESQGILDIALKLYMLAQWQIIGSDDERITPGLIRSLAKDNLHAVEPILRALRNKDLERLKNIVDIALPDNLISDHYRQAVRRVSLQGTLNTLENQTTAEGEDVGESPEERVTELLVQAGHPLARALYCAQAACRRFAKETDLVLASSEAFRLAAEASVAAQTPPDEPPPVPTAKKPAKVVTFSGDLRDIIKKAGSKTPPYEALKEAGVIKPGTEFMAAGDL